MSLENCLAYLNDDELLEITPTTYRMRKMYLTELERKGKPRESQLNSYNKSKEISIR
jgi:GTP-binding protein